jgi:hypothetical protein
MLPKTLAVYLDNDLSGDHYLDILYNYFKNSYEDFVVISDENSLIKSTYAVIPSLYLKFFKGDVIFMSAATFLEKEDILANKIYLCASINELLDNNICKSRLKNVTLIDIKQSAIEVFKNDCV